jgi:hypothetical protein
MKAITDGGYLELVNEFKSRQVKRYFRIHIQRTSGTS